MRPKQNSGTSEDAAVQKILASAAQCFAAKGSRKTSMNEIADAAGVGRQTVYRRFKNREEIIEAVFQQRVQELLRSMREARPPAEDLEDQIIDTTLDWVRRIKMDPVLRNLVAESDSHETELFLIGPQSPLQSIAVDIWTPILQRARQNGQLRPQLSFDEAVQYVRAFHYLLHVRDDLHERERVEFVRNTLLTILIRDDRNKYQNA